MQTYTLKVSSLHDPTCIRTLELTSEQTLETLAAAIQQEFALWESDRRVFFMSGELGDWTTAFDCAEGAGAVTLGALELAPGMEIASLHDNRFPHTIEIASSGTAAEGASYPNVLAREGTPPPADEIAQLGEIFEEDHSAGCCGGGEEHDCGGCEEASDCAGCGSEESEQSEEAGCGGGCCGGGHDCCGDDEAAHGEDCECADCVEIAEARASFDDVLLEKVEAALDHTMEEEELDASVVQSAIEAIARACPDRDALERLSIATDTPLDEWGSAMIAVLQDERGPKNMVDLAGRWAKLTGEFEDVVLHAEIVARAGNLDAALKIIAPYPVRSSREEDWKQLMTARLQVLGGRLTDAEPGLRAVLDRRWLPGPMRELAVAVLSDGLRAVGREREVEMLQRSEQARLKQLDSMRGVKAAG